MEFAKTFSIGKRKVGEGQPTYFIAEIGANFDGSLETAKKLSNRPAFLEFDETALSAKVLRIPERGETSFPINDQLIIEYYSR